MGTGANSYAGQRPVIPIPGTNTPNNQFAAALGNAAKAINGINNG